MPLADFSVIWSTPEISDRFLVIRREDTIDQNGRSQPLVVARYQAIGVVTIASANDLRRVPEQEVQNKTISISTPFQIQGARFGQQPDLIHWHGEDYVVIDIQDYGGFGPGFYNALAQRLDANPPSDAPPEQLRIPPRW